MWHYVSGEYFHKTMRRQVNEKILDERCAGDFVYNSRNRSTAISVFAATVRIYQVAPYNKVDSGKHMDYDARSSNYESSIAAGAKIVPIPLSSFRMLRSQMKIGETIKPLDQRSSR